MATITVVGLGPGPIGYMSLETFELLKSGAPVFLRTEQHPCVVELQSRGVNFTSFDVEYENSSTFEDVYLSIANRLLRAANTQDIVYAVPGHPRNAERSVRVLLELAEKAGHKVEIKNAMSFLDPVFTIVGIDPIDGVAVVDGSAELWKIDYRVWNVIPQIYDRFTASERKLDLMNVYPDEHKIFVVQRAGNLDERVIVLPIFEMDREEYFDHLTCIAVPPLRPEEYPPDWDKLLEVMAQLRGEEGCPWDIEQTHLSLRPYLLEETYEVLEALNLEDMHKLCEELGDLLLQIVFHAQLGQESGAFTSADVLREIIEKLIRRHPHVFADWQVSSAGEVVTNWDKIKQQEVGGRDSVLDGLTMGLPALMLASKVQSKAAKTGFDWEDFTGPINKIQEELAELMAAENHAQQTDELGDLLFSVVNLARFLKVEPELALHGTIERFIRRFKFVEQVCREKSLDMTSMDITELDKLWEIAKKTEKNGKVVDN